MDDELQMAAPKEALAQADQDLSLYRRALKWVLTHQREQVGVTSIWRNQHGVICHPSIYVETVLAIVERELYLEAESAG